VALDPLEKRRLVMAHVETGGSHQISEQLNDCSGSADLMVQHRWATCLSRNRSPGIRRLHCFGTRYLVDHSAPRESVVESSESEQKREQDKTTAGGDMQGLMQEPR
jgi:hypothetical protein